MKSRILKVSVFIVMVITMLVLLTGCTTNENVINQKNEIIENEVVENKQNTNTIETEATKSESEIVEDLFFKYLENPEEVTGFEEERLEEYKIDKIEVLKGTKRQEVLDTYEGIEGNNVNEKDIFAVITYSVKPKSIDNTTWIAGNGEVEGGWIVRKSACIFVRNNNGAYKIQGVGTGW